MTALTLLADRARDERLVPAFLGVWRASLAPHLRRAFERRGDVEAVAALIAFGLAQRDARTAAVRGAVRGCRAQFVTGHDVGARQARDRAGRVGHAFGKFARRIRG